MQKSGRRKMDGQRRDQTADHDVISTTLCRLSNPASQMIAWFNAACIKTKQDLEKLNMTIPRHALEKSRENVNELASSEG